MLYFFDSKIAVKGLPFGKEGNDTIFTYFGNDFYIWLNHDYSMKRRIEDEIMMSAKVQPRSAVPLSSTLSLEGTMSPNILMT